MKSKTNTEFKKKHVLAKTYVCLFSFPSVGEKHVRRHFPTPEKRADQMLPFRRSDPITAFRFVCTC